MLKQIKIDCNKNNIKLHILKRSDYRDSISQVVEIKSYQGWFCSKHKELVAWQTPQMYQVLAHEYSHMLQFVENYPPAVKLIKGINASSMLDLCRMELELPSAVINQALTQVLQLEWDCERRTLALFDEYNLAVNKRRYLATAMSILYAYVFETRTGKKINIPSCPPFLLPIADGLLEKLPKKFKIDEKIYSKFANYLKQ